MKQGKISFKRQKNHILLRKRKNHIIKKDFLNILKNRLINLNIFKLGKGYHKENEKKGTTERRYLLYYH